METSKKLVINGVFWSAVQMVVTQSFSFVIRLILAKILFPEEFGIVGMATVFTGFVQVLNDLGIAAALVQRKEEALRDEHFHTAFWTGVSWATVLYIILCFIVGPFASSFYNEPLLLILIPVLSLGILASPINMVHKAQLTKAMDFRKIAWIGNVSAISAGILALVLAFMGGGIWSLAFNTVATVVFAIPFFFKATKWKPKFVWNKSAFKDIFGFGISTTGTNVVNYWINNVDYLIIGKMLSAGTLGAYTFAFVLTDTFRTKLMSVINNVMYPMYGKKQSDPETLKRYYLKVVNFNAIIIFPIMLALIVLGEPLIYNIFGDKWEQSIDPLRILALAVMVHMMVNSNTALIRGMGKPLLEFKLQCIKAAIFISTLIFGIVYYGIVGAAIAVLINKIIAVIIAQYTFNRLLNIKIATIEFLESVKAPWFASILSGGMSFVLFNFLKVNYILVLAFLFSAYSAIIWLLMKDEIRRQIYEFKTFRKSRKN